MRRGKETHIMTEIKREERVSREGMRAAVDHMLKTNFDMDPRAVDLTEAAEKKMQERFQTLDRIR